MEPAVDIEVPSRTGGRRPWLGWGRLRTLIVPASVWALTFRSPDSGADPNECTGPIPSFDTDALKALSDILMKRVDHLGQVSTALGTVNYLSLLCIGLTVATIVRRRESLEIQGVEVPVVGLHATIGVVMVYLWVNFVSHLKELLELHRSLERCIEWVEKSWPALHYARPLLREGGFFDAWQRLSTDWRSDPDFWQHALYMVGMAVAVGLAHASVHAIIEEAETRWGKSAWTWIALFMLAVLIVYPYSWLTGSESGALFARLASSSFPAWCAMLWYLGDRWSPSRRGAPLDASTA